MRKNVFFDEAMNRKRVNLKNSLTAYWRAVDVVLLLPLLLLLEYAPSRIISPHVVYRIEDQTLLAAI